ncbi:Crp/Fnr family transcriptional regulator [Winogradskyella aurantia]|uniref:Crp/Fnr family transcriptional regulator n=1 Tax=Winogradskyella aurantia TaxID=1915063 RepID=A0A265URR1_9FLAO|nr:Crp/Fnr family transcriptional regulator [Winogradskyella aurantia]OZV67991.1 Crp/Fnr family transcriptional regulator [Winogradskyella aurantia]
MKKINVKKGEILQRSGDLNSSVYHVISGLLRSFTIDEKGKEHIFMFAPENWTIADSQPKDTPCDLYIDALEDSTIIAFNKDIKRESQNVGAFINRLAVLQNRVIMLMSFSALKRYEHFEETYPDIIQRVTQKMIASYLGITPEALSKIKKERIK